MQAHPLAWATVGFHGKLPARGDFVTRGLPTGLVSTLDEWLQDGVAASRNRLGDRWLPLYLDSPVWHFALDAGLADPAPVTGLTIPSVDQVGRYFPLLVAAPLPLSGNLLDAIDAAAGWRAAAEKAALLALRDGTNLPDLERAVAALGLPANPQASAQPMPTPMPTPMPMRACGRLAEEALRARHDRPLALWWSDGSQRVGSALLASAGLPDPDAFASLLDGDWTRLAPLGITILTVGDAA